MKLRRIITVILCFIMLLQVPIIAQATENPSTGEYITFTTGNERIKSDGSFTFGVSSEMMSGHFTADKTSIKISSKCKKFNVNTGSSVSTTAYQYTLTLYKKGTGKAVGSYTGYANNKNASKSFTVEEGAEYYFTIACSPELTFPERLSGSGKVTNVTPV